MKKVLFITLTALFCFSTANAQKTVVSQKNQKVYDVVEQMPEYTGGMSALIDFLSTNIKYPEDAQKQKVEGRVLVNFVVEVDGSITDIQVLKQAFPSLDAEAVRVVKAMPHWTPGKVKGKPVRVRYTLPIVYRLK